METKLIFLDIDGVLNCENGYVNGFCKYTNFTDSPKSDDVKNHYQKFYPPSKMWVNKLIDDTDAKVVISSTWRLSGLEWLKRIWVEEGMSGEIIDITPRFYSSEFSIPRGCEIEWWQKKHNHRTFSFDEERYIITPYVIIDDDADMLLTQKDNFVNVEPSPINKEGFNESHYLKGLAILNK